MPVSDEEFLVKLREAFAIEAQEHLQATNAGLLAAQILALSDWRLAARVMAWRAAQTDSVAEAVEDNA